METVAAQQRQPDEIVICDGGSTDQTLAILQEYTTRLPLKLIQQIGANISAGRNAALRASTGEIIAITDAGVRLDPNWLAALLVPFEAQPETGAVAGFFLADPHTPFEAAMGATVLPTLAEIDPASFAPSSRSVAFRRAVIVAAGGYPEWLDFCEDLILDFRVMERLGGFRFAPGAVAYFRPRGSLRSFWKQYYQYARGDGKAGLFPRRHLIRYSTYLFVLPLLIGAALWLSPLAWLALAAGGLFMVWKPYRRLFQQWGALSPAGKIEAVLWVPLIRVWGDLAKMAGYPAGLRWRRVNQPPDWRSDPAHELS